jgi:hypothetical protein
MLLRIWLRVAPQKWTTKQEEELVVVPCRGNEEIHLRRLSDTSMMDGMWETLTRNAQSPSDTPYDVIGARSMEARPHIIYDNTRARPYIIYDDMRARPHIMYEDMRARPLIIHIWVLSPDAGISDVIHQSYAP